MQICISHIQTDFNVSVRCLLVSQSQLHCRDPIRAVRQKKFVLSVLVFLVSRSMRSTTSRKSTRVAPAAPMSAMPVHHLVPPSTVFPGESFLKKDDAISKRVKQWEKFAQEFLKSVSSPQEALELQFSVRTREGAATYST